MALTQKFITSPVLTSLRPFRMSNPLATVSNTTILSEANFDLVWDVIGDGTVNWFRVTANVTGTLSGFCILTRTGGDTRYDIQEDVTISNEAFWFSNSPVVSAPGTNGVFQEGSSNSALISIDFTPGVGTPSTYCAHFNAYQDDGTGLDENLASTNALVMRTDSITY